MVGRNVGIDDARRKAKQQALPDGEAISDLDDAEVEMADRLDESHYRDDILRLLFICRHPDLPQTQQIAVALRIVCGLSVKQIARAFLVSESAMEQRITRAKARISMSGIVILFLLVDGGFKMLPPMDVVVETTAQLGWPSDP